MDHNSAMFVGSKTAAEIGSYYQYQGVRNNDCGPFSLAMAINLQLGAHRVDGNELGELMQADSLGFGLLRYRFTSLMGARKGATSPWGLATAYREIGPRLAGVDSERLGRIRWLVRGTKERLIGNVNRGVLSTLLLVWQAERDAHFATVVGYCPAVDEFLLLDSATGGDKSSLPPQDRLLAVPWPKIDADWSRRPWWLVWFNRVMLETELPPSSSRPSRSEW